MTPSEQSYREIPLTQGQVAFVSAHRFGELSKFNWMARWSPCTKSFYASRNFRLPDGKRRTMQMHREILGLEYGDKRQGDHRSGNTLDNRDENLRIATAAQNTRNSHAQANNTSGFKGVSWHKYSKKWAAFINFNHKRKHLGLYATAEEAYSAHCKAAKELHGEFACVELPVTAIISVSKT